MTLNLVHLGHGETALLESPDFIDPTVTLPKAPQRANKRRLIGSERMELLRAVLGEEASIARSYRKTPILHARHDQCRYIAPQETSVCCGKKVTNLGSSWCEVHRKIVFSRRQPACGNTVDYRHKPHFFSKA